MRTALRISVIAIVAVSGAAWLLLSATAQKRRNEFFHSTAAHKKLDCASCHKPPTPNSVRVRGFPDVADYPGHSSCVQCHRSDFFQGNNPAICTICHTSPSPRNGTRFPFPVRGRSQEFTTIFPHNAHQDIIARNERSDGTVPAHFVNASFGGRIENTEALAYARATDTGPPADDPPPQYNNCAICHQPSSVLPKFGSRAPVDGNALAGASVDSFVPGAAFFKTSPDSHASCFSCHYQGQKPVSTDCAGCHRPAAPYLASNVITRYSLKYDHATPASHAIKDCTTCHVRITQNSDIFTMKDADVPFMTCASCHDKDFEKERKKRTESIAAKQPVFQCAYCHVSEIGRFEMPASHRLP
jgi:hypothetical protein